MTAELHRCHGTTGKRGVLMPDDVTYYGPVWTDDGKTFYVLYRDAPHVVHWNAASGQYVITKE